MAKNENKTELSPEQKKLAAEAQAADVGDGTVPPLPTPKFNPVTAVSESPKPAAPLGASIGGRSFDPAEDALRKELYALEEEHAKLSLQARVQDLREKVRSLKHGKRSDETVGRIEKREKLRASTHVTTDRDGKQFAHYITGDAKSFVHGMMAEPGTKVTVPFEELPSVTWKAQVAAKPKQEFVAAD